MDASRVGDARDGRFDELHAEAKAALGNAANTIDAVSERYRDAFLEEMSRYQAMRDELDALERRPRRERMVDPDRDGRRAARREASREAASTAEASPPEPSAAGVGADDARSRSLRRELERLEADVGGHQSELARMELAHRNLETTWLFLERGDASLVSGAPGATGADDGASARPTDLDLRIVEAQEAERSRLAQEIHDGPAQALSNAIFQVEYIERVIESDPRIARSELRFMRELLRRELGDVRTFISQLRPPLLDEMGLDGSILDAAETMTALLGVTVETDLGASDDRLGDAQQTVVLRVVQEALQNVRKHAKATTVTIATRIEDDRWVVDVRDDGQGFDVGAVAARGRRNFGLQFMRERAELIGALLEVSSGPEAGTVVRLVIPIEEESR